MISTANITMQFGAKPLFENVSVKFNNSNRYGLIGANGCGKSTFMKILGGDLEPSGGQVMLEPNVRLGKLKQDQFAYEEFSVVDTVIMGHTELWAVKAERDRIYALPDMTEDAEIPAFAAGDFPTLNIPTLIVWAMEDLALPPSNIEGIEALVPEVEVVSVHDCGHFVIWEKPEAVNTAMEKFLA